ncbi:insulin-like peptide INSL6 [Tupaia chinensis]|uniref:Insulin-like peptide INSL6 n=1 Tax=Tupaia chinensis TaxID=246437 RepID=L9KJZ0_TUPCH|nr:insulin-like peptide INSL6 [Tupaia chinensis]ELW63071.1 Insulin-like peptide INSL6 [Tupaia chinensis]
MPQLVCWCLLWLWFLVRFSCELNDISTARKLCGRHLLKEILTLCGHDDWSQFHLEEEIPFAHMMSRDSEKVEAFLPDEFESSQTPFMIWERGTHPVSTASPEEAINSSELQSLPESQNEKANSHPEKTREFSLLSDINPSVHESVTFQKKSTNKINTLSNLFWGNHPQRRRRGYSEKCCIKGCTKEELSIACLPYINFKNLKGPSLVTQIY